jgi:acyl carrier protein
MEDLNDRLKKIIADHLEIDMGAVTDTASFADLGADSLAVIEITMALEEEFSVEINDDDLESAKTVAEVAALIRRLIA